METEFLGTATYSPEDNKLRFTPFSRLSKENYARIRAAGFIWAPKQELFVAAMWTPDREDLMVEWCGEVCDEDKSLVERAEERAGRFDDYSAKREADADRARAGVAAIADGIPFGQPILVGHHSERHARKDAERIENGMRKAVKMWETSKYWTDRAAGALAHAKYKEIPEVRARRIKGIEADRRKVERSKDESARALRFWRGEMKLKAPGDSDSFTLPITEENRDKICKLLGGVIGTFAGVRFNDATGHAWSSWDYLQPDGERYSACPSKTVEECRQVAERVFTRSIARSERWLAHYDNRLAYERAMIAADGGTVTDKTGPEVGGACRCWAAPGHGEGWALIKKVNRVSVTIWHTYQDGGRSFAQTMAFDKLRAVMSRAEVEQHRAAGELIEDGREIGFFLRGGTDRPTGTDEKELATATPTGPEEKGAQFDALRDTLKAGIKVAVVPQLFETPREIATRMVELADIQPGHAVLEPSAGKGMIVGALGGSMFGHNPERGRITAIEINPTLCEHLRREFPLTEVRCADFIECVDERGFDRILMNPPFANAADIKHVRHALTMLRPGGILVAICAGGPRQERDLEAISDLWEPLPDGTFKDAGTNVRTVLLTITKPAEVRKFTEARQEEFALTP